MELESLKLEFDSANRKAALNRYEEGQLVESRDITEEVVGLAAVWLSGNSPVGSRVAPVIGGVEYVLLCQPKDHFERSIAAIGRKKS